MRAKRRTGRADARPLPAPGGRHAGSELTVRRPLVPLAALVVAGAMLGPGPGFTAPIGVCALLLGAALRSRAPRTRALALVVASFAAGASLAGDAPPHGEPPTDEPRAPVSIVAEVVERPALRQDGWTSLARLRSTAPGRDLPPPGTLVALSGPTRPAPPAAGDRVALLARLTPRTMPANPGARPPADGATWRAAPAGGTALVRLREAGSPPGGNAADRLQRALLEAVDRGLPGPEARLLGAMLLGEPGRLAPSQRGPFVDTGTAHLLAISGLHLGLVAVVLLRLLEGALRRVPRLVLRGAAIRLAAVTTLLACIGYTALSGWHLPTRRALAMIVVHLGARAAGRRADAPSSLATAALLIVATEPGAVLAPGFQLSFTAVGGLLLGAHTGEALARRACALREGRSRSALRALVLLGWTSWVAWLATSPLILFHFGACPLAAPPINAVAVPLLGVTVMPLALVCVPAAALLPWDPALVLAPVRLALSALVGWVEVTRPMALPVSGAGAWAALVLAAGLTAWVALWAEGALGGRRPWRLAVAAVTAVGLAIAALPRGPSGLVVAFLDVGHGDAAVIRLPDGTGIVVDGGGHHGDGGATGRRVVLPAIRALGITRLRAVVLTHPDADHLLGLIPVVAAMPPDALWWSGHVVQSPAELVLLATAAVGGARIDPVGAGSAGVVVAGARIEVLGPDGGGTTASPGSWVPGGGTNDSSVILRLRYGRVSFLLPGDAERGEEERLVASGRLGPVTVLKVPHHGSTTSSTPALVTTARPAHVVVSCDEHDHRGLPKATVLRRWEASGAIVHRTDRSGAVVFRTDGESLEVSHGR